MALTINCSEFPELSATCLGPLLGGGQGHTSKTGALTPPGMVGKNCWTGIPEKLGMVGSDPVGPDGPGIPPTDKVDPDVVFT